MSRLGAGFGGALGGFAGAFAVTNINRVYPAVKPTDAHVFLVTLAGAAIGAAFGAGPESPCPTAQALPPPRFP